MKDLARFGMFSHLHFELRWDWSSSAGSEDDGGLSWSPVTAQLNVIHSAGSLMRGQLLHKRGCSGVYITI